MNPAEINALEPRAKELHAWFNANMGTQYAWSTTWLHRWIEWLSYGHNGPELVKVIKFLRKEISTGKRNIGSLNLVNLLNHDVFEKDLAQAQMVTSGKLDPDQKLTRPPDTTPQPKSVPLVPLNPSAVARERNYRTAENGPTPEQYAAEIARRNQVLEDLKRSMI